MGLQTSLRRSGKGLVGRANSRQATLARLCTDRVALVTGAGGGLGREVADVFATVGMTVYALCRRDQDSLPDNVLSIQCDVRDALSVSCAVDGITRTEPNIDLVVNCAGTFSPSICPAPDFVEHLENAVETNFLGAVYVAQTVLPHMIRRRRGLLINVCSSWADLDCPSAGAHAYKASKAALESFTGSLNAEYRNAGIAAIAYKPPKLATAMTGFVGADPFDGAMEILNLSLRHLSKTECRNATRAD